MKKNSASDAGGQNQEALEASINEFNATFSSVEGEVGRVLVGMRDVIRRTLAAIFAGGHVLLEGSPGLGKTLLVKSISRALGMTFKRIQFTPDLMPSDVTGTQVLTEDDTGRRVFTFKPGPIFANIVLADEINRATPKTQSSLLEAMEERQVTVLDETYKLPTPFFVLATQNPIELEGTYPLPEAQLDRFMVKLLVQSPTPAELKQVLQRTTGNQIPESTPVMAPDEMVQSIGRMRQLVREVIVPDPLQDVLVRMFTALTPNSQYATEAVNKYVKFGPGPRGAQSVILCGKVSALLDSRINLAFEDIRSVILPALRHRLILNFQAEADGISADEIIDQIRNAK